MLKFRQFLKLLFEQITNSNNFITEIPCKYKNVYIKWTDKQLPRHALDRYLERAKQNDKSEEKFYQFIQKGVDKYLIDDRYYFTKEQLDHVFAQLTSISNPSWKIELSIYNHKNSFTIILDTTLQNRMFQKLNKIDITIENKDQHIQIIID